MINITIIGASGKMGRSLCKLILENNNTNLVSAIVKNNKNIGKIVNNNSNIHFDDNLDKAIQNSDIAIDFSTEKNKQNILDLCEKYNTKLIIGTTGLNDTQEQQIINASSNVAIVYTSNFSIGVNVLFAITEKTARVLKTDAFQTHIDEKHHVNKVDAPSGTALTLGKLIAQTRGHNFNEVCKYNATKKQLNTNSNNDITFSVSRETDIIGEHNIHFNSHLETLSLSHKATDRTVFSYGAIVASLWLVNQENGLYTMRDVLEI